MPHLPLLLHTFRFLMRSPVEISGMEVLDAETRCLHRNVPGNTV